MTLIKVKKTIYYKQSININIRVISDLIMYSKLICVAIYLFLLGTSDVNGDFLFKFGWYKTYPNGSKTEVSEISSLDKAIIGDTKYLKLKAKIPVLFPGSVKNIESLEILKLVSCNVHTILPQAFRDIPNISMIALNDNKLKGIKTGIFNNLNVSTILLHRNKIQFIESEAFDNMTRLIKLQLNSNFISYWDNNWFKHTPQLSELYFRRNAIRTVPSRAFKNVPVRNRKLKIYLSKNYISSLEKDAFYGLKECGQIWLDRNEIVDLNERLLADMEYLEVLILAKNFLSSVPNKLCNHLKSDLISLDLTNNNNLTCLDYELVQKVKLTNVQKIRGLDCGCIKNLKNKFVNNLQNNEINSDC